MQKKHFGWLLVGIVVLSVCSFAWGFGRRLGDQASELIFGPRRNAEVEALRKELQETQDVLYLANFQIHALSEVNLYAKLAAVNGYLNAVAYKSRAAKGERFFDDLTAAFLDAIEWGALEVPAGKSILFERVNRLQQIANDYKYDGIEPEADYRDRRSHLDQTLGQVQRALVAK